MAQANKSFSGILPVPIGGFGNGQPTIVLNSTSDYLAWKALNVDTPYNPSTTWNPPKELMCIDTAEGGIYSFLLSGPRDAISNYQFRTKKSNDSDYSAWQTCTTTRIELDNDDYNIGGVQVKRIAGSGKAESPVLSSSSKFSYYVYPLYIKSFYFNGPIFHATVQVGVAEFIRIVTNGYRQDFYPTRRDPGVYEFTYDFTGFEGQYQVITFMNGEDYISNKVKTVVPTASASNNTVTDNTGDTV